MKSAFSARRGAAAALVAAALLFSVAAQAQNITVRDWGVTDTGATVQLYTLKGPRGVVGPGKPMHETAVFRFGIVQ